MAGRARRVRAREDALQPLRQMEPGARLRPLLRRHDNRRHRLLLVMRPESSMPAY